MITHGKPDSSQTSSEGSSKLRTNKGKQKFYTKYLLLAAEWILG